MSYRAVAASCLAMLTWFATANAGAQTPTDQSTMRQMQASANAQMDAQARARFRVGQSLYETGRFQEAATEFAAAYQLSQRPQLLFNLYVAYRDASDIPHATEALRNYLAAMPADIDDRLNLEARLRSMEAVVAQQQQDQQARQDAANQPQPVATPAQTAAIAEPMNESRELPAPETHRSPVGLIVAGVGGALLVTGAITGVLAMGKVRDLESVCVNGLCPQSAVETRDSARTLVTITDVMLIGGGVLTVGGFAYWLFGPKQTETAPSASASAFCNGSSCMVSVQGQF